jgi:two-component system phosphate regulon sensor histidine kinase PhoR
LLDGAIKDKEVRKKFLKKSARNLDYIDVLIQDLLVLSQIESEAIRMIPDHFDIIGLVEEVLDDQERKAAKTAISLEFSFDKSPMIVFADYSRIRQVLTNLVNNGINYSKAGGKVAIKLEDRARGVKISVIDDGVGIAEKYHDRIFNRFFRIDKSRTVKKSTGLGLAIVKHILERHNTTISVESSPGKGSTFSFVLLKDKTKINETEPEL